MHKSFYSKQRLLLLVACLLISPVYLIGQDLGSSSEFLRNKSKKKKKTSRTSRTKKKKTSKRKSKTRRKTTKKKKSTRKTTARRTTVKKRSSKKKTTVRRRSTTTTRSLRNNRKPKAFKSVIITRGNAGIANSAELYENAIGDGNRARNIRNYLGAERAYRRAKSLNPTDSRAIYGLGNIYSDQQRWEEAEKAYRQAIRLEPSNPSAHIAISYVLTQPVVGSNLGERYVEAEKMARRAIRLDPNNAIGYDQLGVALELRGFIGNETENAYHKAISYYPEFALAYAHLGRLLRKKGLRRRSSVAYRKAKAFSTDVPTMILVADVMQSQQRFLDSERLLRKALRQDPKNPTGLYLLGRALTTRRSFTEAETILKKSVSVSPNSFVSYTLLGSMYYRRGDLNKAEKVLNNALRVISKNEEKRLAQEFEEIGDRYLEIDKKSDALRVYLRAKKLDRAKKSLNSKILQARTLVGFRN